jgi:DNA-binding NtrC family response regulator
MPSQASHILVVDDDSDMCWALEHVLTADGFEVIIALTGAEALERVAEQAFHVVFIDAKLPDQDGFQLAASILEHRADTAIVLVSGYYYQEDQAIIEGLRQNLFMTFVAKPFDLSVIRDIARTAARSAH